LADLLGWIDPDRVGHLELGQELQGIVYEVHFDALGAAA